ncbi:MAG: hypothetical protein WC627_10035 [Legionella sp.]|jgi:hypothetical protein
MSKIKFFSERDVKLFKTLDENKNLSKIEIEVENVRYIQGTSQYANGHKGVTVKLNDRKNNNFDLKISIVIDKSIVETNKEVNKFLYDQLSITLTEKMNITTKIAECLKDHELLKPEEKNMHQHASNNSSGSNFGFAH